MSECAAKGRIVIAGAGVTGLMMALRIKQIDPDADIVIFDKADRPGGMYQSVEYDNGRVFDHGMHVIYESCNPVVDNLYRKVMDEEEWHIYEHNEKDIAGLYFRGCLQDYSHYVDLRSFSEEERKRFLGRFMVNLEMQNATLGRSALQCLLNQFGHDIVDTVHRPLLQSLYGIAIEEVDRFALKATALERVILFNTDTMLELMQSGMIRSRLAFPDQLNLPPYRTHGQKALYPRQFGMKHFISRLEEAVRREGIELLTGVSGMTLHTTGDCVDTVRIVDSQECVSDLKVDTLFWTIGWPGIAQALGVDISGIRLSRGTNVVYANLVFDKPPEMGKLYYFYCYDSGFATFRVTHYASYCPAAAIDGFPVCVELWPSRLGLVAGQMSDEECLALVLDELQRMGVTTSAHTLLFSAIENKGGEFPLPSIANMAGLHEISKRVQDRDMRNIKITGILADDDLFFIPDILNHAFLTIHDTFQERGRT